ncbi:MULTISPECIES: hypothetical protein [Pontibacillus]|uniref:Uncharacterized protein n=1 Tax=Pontibacillus chungwhensis TaxID=265426 RepID=A0ABY8V1J7_9BACI|nr:MULTISPECIES: hypothetical protein [Pontibacillus]WIF99368.1 hypothetical protein QNI29_06840 [Pontibacillus chungwhensis]
MKATMYSGYGSTYTMGEGVDSMAFDYAELPKEKLQEIKKLEEQLGIVLIAFDSKYLKHPETKS